MTKLSDVVSGLLGDLARSNMAIEQASRLVATEQTTEDLSFVSMPRIRITNAQVTLHFSVAESSGSTITEPSPEIRRLWDSELRNIAILSIGNKPSLAEGFTSTISDEAFRQILKGNSTLIKKELEDSVTSFRNRLPVKVRRTLPKMQEVKLKMRELLDKRLQVLGPKIQRLQVIHEASSRDLDIFVSKDELESISSDKMVDLTLQISLDEIDSVSAHTISAEPN